MGIILHVVTGLAREVVYTFSSLVMSSHVLRAIRNSHLQSHSLLLECDLPSPSRAVNVEVELAKELPASRRQFATTL